jgi:hypothetical protein
VKHLWQNGVKGQGGNAEGGSLPSTGAILLVSTNAVQSPPGEEHISVKAHFGGDTVRRQVSDRGYGVKEED